jgi:hypothetical protein
MSSMAMSQAQIVRPNVNDIGGIVMEQGGTVVQRWSWRMENLERMVKFDRHPVPKSSCCVFVLEPPTHLFWFPRYSGSVLVSKYLKNIFQPAWRLWSISLQMCSYHSYLCRFVQLNCTKLGFHNIRQRLRTSSICCREIIGHVARDFSLLRFYSARSGTKLHLSAGR